MPATQAQAANPANAEGLIDLFLQAGTVGKLVLLLLALASVYSWAIIFMKWRSIRRADAENEMFLNAFWHSKNIEEIFTKSAKFERSPVASVFKSGFKELKKLSGMETKDLAMENINRAMLRASNNEISMLERNVSWLATIASAAPFVGLFGTVLGIMNSFREIGASGAANLAVVAPGISEALIATAAGIGAAIPAVVAYNHFAGLIKRQAVDMDSFSHDFINIVRRSVLGTTPSRQGG